MKIRLISVIVATVILATGTIFFLTYKNQQSVLLPYKIGRFTLEIPNSYIHGDKSKIEKSSIKQSEMDESCSKIGNIYVFYTFRKLAGIYPNVQPSLSVYGWKDPELVYFNKNSETTFKEWGEQLENIGKYTDLNLLQQKVFAPEYDASKNVEPNLDLGKFLYCSGVYSYPILIEKVETKKFESVFFAEVIEGNADLGAPKKELVIYHKNNWLIVSEQPDYKSHNWDFNYCPNNLARTRVDLLKCTEKLWREKYRSKKENASWINFILSHLEFEE